MITLLKVLGLNPSTKEQLAYLKWTRKDTEDTQSLSERMSEASSAFTLGEVGGVTLDIPKFIRYSLLEGNAVTINGLGTFRLRVNGTTQPSKDKLSKSDIKSMSVIFDADSRFEARLNEDATYELTERVTKEGEQDLTDEEKASESSTSGTDSGSGGTTTPSGTGSAD